MSSSKIIIGDCIEELNKLPEKSVHCCVTSPPYWGLRQYIEDGAPEKRYEIGLEKTPEEFLAKMVAVFRAVWRVLRDDGTCWVNLGDSYNAAGREGHGTRIRFKQGTNRASAIGDDSNRPSDSGLKPKDLCGMPWRVAFALQADGWYLRSDIIWQKPNPMPESVTDRPTKAHEYIFLLTKKQRYFYDAEAIKEPVNGGAHDRVPGNINPAKGAQAYSEGDHRQRTKAGLLAYSQRKRTEAGSGVKNNKSFEEACSQPVSSRNKRTVWTVPSAPYKERHFATFPPDLITPCILAGTSARGCCPKCGAPWERVVENGAPDLEHQRRCGGDSNGQYFGKATKDFAASKAQDASATKARILAGMVEKKTVGWKPTCECGESQTIPCTVLDCFGGSGTVGQVATEFGRDSILIELNPAYAKLADRRTDVTPGLALA